MNVRVTLVRTMSCVWMGLPPTTARAVLDIVASVVKQVDPCHYHRLSPGEGI